MTEGIQTMLSNVGRHLQVVVDPLYCTIDYVQMGLSWHESPSKALKILGMTMTQYVFTY